MQSDQPARYPAHQQLKGAVKACFGQPSSEASCPHIFDLALCKIQDTDYHWQLLRLKITRPQSFPFLGIWF